MIRNLIVGSLTGILLLGAIGCQKPGAGMSPAQVDALMSRKVDSVRSYMQAENALKMDSIQKEHQQQVRSLEMKLSAKSGGKSSAAGSSASKGGSKGGSSTKTTPAPVTKPATNATDSKIINRGAPKTGNQGTSSPAKDADSKIRNRGGGK